MSKIQTSEILDRLAGTAAIASQAQYKSPKDQSEALILIEKYLDALMNDIQKSNHTK